MVAGCKLRVIRTRQLDCTLPRRLQLRVRIGWRTHRHTTSLPMKRRQSTNHTLLGVARDHGLPYCAADLSYSSALQTPAQLRFLFLPVGPGARGISWSYG